MTSFRPCHGVTIGLRRSQGRAIKSTTWGGRGAAPQLHITVSESQAHPLGSRRESSSRKAVPQVGLLVSTYLRQPQLAGEPRVFVHRCGLPRRGKAYLIAQPAMNRRQAAARDNSPSLSNRCTSAATAVPPTVGRVPTEATPGCARARPPYSAPHIFPRPRTRRAAAGSLRNPRVRPSSGLRLRGR